MVFGFAILCGVLYQLESMKKGIKYSIVGVVFCCACGVVLHAHKQSIIEAKIAEFRQAFYDNETLVCMQDNTEIHVNKMTFVYFKDLDLFSGKDSMEGLNVPILSCIQHVTTYDSDFIND